MKLPASAGNAPAEPAMPTPAPAAPPTEDLDFGGESQTEPIEPETPEAPANDNPFDKEPFDAGIDVDEESDPKKFIEKLSGKIGQSLRDYTKAQGQPDFELEKFAINSLVSATHTAEMDEKDRNDIIKKINTAGENDAENPDMGDDNNDANSGDDNNDGAGTDFGGDAEAGMEETRLFEDNNIFLENPKKNNMFQDGSNDILDEDGGCWHNAERVPGTKKGEKGSCRLKEESDGLWANIRAKRERGESPAKPGDKGYPDKKQWNKLTKEGEGESNNYMFWQNLKTIHHTSGELLNMNHDEIDEICENGHAWAVDHISTSADDIEEVYHFMEANVGGEDYNGDTEHGYEDEHGSVEHMMSEGQYDDKPLGKPMHGDVKKFKVYVKNAKGNVVKVNFGDPNMEIKRDNPERRKSFRARHKCSQAKDRTTPKYWSCKMWSKTPVSKMVAEDLTGKEKSSIFDKNMLKSKLQETFNQEIMSEPLVKPIVKPTTKPAEPAPSRKNRPFTIEPDTIPQVDPKAINEGKFDYETYHKTLSSTLDEVREYVLKRGFDNVEFSMNDVQHVAYGHTERFSKELTKNNKPLRQTINVQIYRMDSGTYELNMYIA